MLRAFALAEVNPMAVDVKAPMPSLFEMRAGDILTDEQVAAVGRVTVEWGMLEWAIHVHAMSICRIYAGDVFGVLTRKPDGRTMAEILSHVLPYYLPDHPVVPELKSVLRRVEAVGNKRNDVVHGVWNITPAVMGKLPATDKADQLTNVIIKQRGREFRQTPWKTEEIIALAEEIADIRLTLNRLIYPLPFPIGRDLSSIAPIPDHHLSTPDWPTERKSST